MCIIEQLEQRHVCISYRDDYRDVRFDDETERTVNGAVETSFVLVTERTDMNTIIVVTVLALILLFIFFLFLMMRRSAQGFKEGVKDGQR